MTSQPSSGSPLRRARAYFYRGWIRRVFRKLGISRVLSKPYWRLAFLLSGSTQTLTIDGHTVAFHSDSATEFKRVNNLAGERDIIADLLQSLNQEDTVYDIGANIGTYTCFVAATIGGENVLAFEPEPGNIDRLRENLRLNNFDTQVLDLALGDTNGQTNLRLSGDEVGAGEHTVTDHANADTIAIQTARGDSLIERESLPRPTVLKIDVEGAEGMVLRGLEKTLTTHIELIYLEIHEEKLTEFGDSKTAILSHLRDIGFEISGISTRGSQSFIKAEKTERR